MRQNLQTAAFSYQNRVEQGLAGEVLAREQGLGVMQVALLTRRCVKFLS